MPLNSVATVYKVYLINAISIIIITVKSASQTELITWNDA